MFGKTDDLIVILLIILLLFGAKKLPELARGIGQAGRELRRGFDGEDEDQPAKKTASKSTGKKSNSK